MTLPLTNPVFLAAGAFELLDPLGEQPSPAQRVARGGKVGGLDLAGELGSLGVDRAIGEGWHPGLLSARDVVDLSDHGVVVVGVADTVDEPPEGAAG